MKRAWAFLITGVALLPAQPASKYQAWFPDGTGLEIYSESTGSTKPNTGAIGIGPGTGSQELVNRVVVDSGNNIVFAYNLEASRGIRQDTVVIRIEPISTATETDMLKNQAGNPQLPRFSGAHLPTIAAVREFSAVKLGEVVTLDILYNRSTGEKIYDVLRPLAGPSPGGLVVTSSPPREEVSLKEIVVRVNKEAVKTPASWMIGTAVRIDIPGHGAYVVA